MNFSCAHKGFHGNVMIVVVGIFMSTAVGYSPYDGYVVWRMDKYRIPIYTVGKRLWQIRGGYVVKAVSIRMRRKRRFEPSVSIARIQLHASKLPSTSYE